MGYEFHIIRFCLTSLLSCFRRSLVLVSLLFPRISYEVNNPFNTPEQKLKYQVSRLPWSFSWLPPRYVFLRMIFWLCTYIRGRYIPCSRSISSKSHEFIRKTNKRMLKGRARRKQYLIETLEYVRYDYSTRFCPFAKLDGTQVQP